MAYQQIHGCRPCFLNEADLGVQPGQQYFRFEIYSQPCRHTAQPLARVFVTKLVVRSNEHAVKFEICGLGLFKFIKQTREFAEVVAASGKSSQDVLCHMDVPFVLLIT